MTQNVSERKFLFNLVTFANFVIDGTVTFVLLPKAAVISYNTFMVKIRRLNISDYSEIKKLISFLNTDDEKFSCGISEMLSGFVSSLMPLNLKFMPESFVLTQDNEIYGLITVCATCGNPCKINITHLILNNNNYEGAKTLVNFVVQKFGAKGANNFVVLVDESHEELLDLFINGCNFRECSSETLWKNDKPMPDETDLNFRQAQNSDAVKICELYNSEINTIYKPSLLRNPNEFKEAFFGGFSNYYKSRFILESEQNLLGYFSVTTADNSNYILDVTTNSGYSPDYSGILSALFKEIISKRKYFYPLVKQKNYTNEASRLGEFLKSKDFYPIQTKHILVKDFYRPIAQEAAEWKIFLTGENRIST